MLDDREPEAGAAGLARAAGVGAIEPLEHARAVLVGDAGTVVADLDPDLVAAGTGRAGLDPDVAVGPAVLDAVVDQVDHDMIERLGVGAHRELGGDLDPDGDVALRRLGLDRP